ncbi:MAG: hypothetical protein ACRD0Z_15430 [Acidimicrobiales bacterium]
MTPPDHSGVSDGHARPLDERRLDVPFRCQLDVDRGGSIGGRDMSPSIVSGSVVSTRREELVHVEHAPHSPAADPTRATRRDDEASAEAELRSSPRPASF